MNRTINYRIIPIVALLATLTYLPAHACLTFCLKHGKEIIYGRNFDWQVDTGAVFVNPRHVNKVAFTLPGKAPVSWTSKYGSVTFNQFSKDIPVGGMNETGLVIECLVSTAKHPPAGKHKTITELQWIQYHLDTCKSVDEVIASAKKVRITLYAANVHYFITDSSGKSAVIEFLQERMVSRTGDELSKKVLANTSYSEEFKRAARSTSAGKPTRFAKADMLVKAYDGKEKPIAYSFKTLDAVAQGTFTKWQVVYDIRQRIIHFRTLTKRKLKTLDLSKLSFEKVAFPYMLDVNSDDEGDVRQKFAKYTQRLNDNLMSTSLRELNKAGLMKHVKPKHVIYIRGVIASYKRQAPAEDP